jgi:POT family proton-dependent oligopeptide transporter
VVTNAAGTEIQPEGMVNINAGLIMTTCFLFAYLSGKFRATTSMLIGALFASLSLFIAGHSTSGWVCVGGIAIFSIGEMLSSPKFSEFIGNFAPDDKKAMYLGFSQIPLAIGWSLEGKFAPMLYDIFASKDSFSRDLLADRGMDPGAIAQIPQGEAFDRLVQYTGESAKSLTHLLYTTHDIGMVWNIIGAIGIVSAAGIFIYGRWTLALVRKR